MKRLLLLTFACLAIASPASADPQDVANEISREMMSPFCDGITLHDCPSDASHDLRTRIAGWAEDGMTEDQIWQRLEDEYGSGIRATPPASGAGLGAWVLPVIAAIVGIGLVALLATKWTRRPRTTSDASPRPVSDEQRRRLDVELARFRDQQS